MSLPKGELALRIAALFRRRPTTHWSAKEKKVARQLARDKCINLDDLTLIERYYYFERKKGDKGIYRRDLCTFLNNYGGERDRAVLWAEKFPKLAYPEAKTSKATVSQPERPEWDETKAAQQRQELSQFREKLRGPAAALKEE